VRRQATVRRNTSGGIVSGQRVSSRRGARRQDLGDGGQARRAADERRPDFLASERRDTKPGAKPSSSRQLASLDASVGEGVE